MTDFHLNAWTGLARKPVTDSVTGALGALWLKRGQVSGDGALGGAAHSVLSPNGGAFDLAPAGEARWVRFELSDEPDATAEITAAFAVPAGPALLRLDEVKFPSGAVARRHVHPGAGIRVLTTGALEIISDTARETATPGHAWFEPANSPVRAEATAGEPMTAFVRFMVPPASYQGQPTIHVLDPAEAALPRHQLTKRHLDAVVQLPSGEVSDSEESRQPGAGSAGSDPSPALAMAAMAQYSSLSEVSPLMPTAPMVTPCVSRTSTPPGTGISRPSEAVASAFWKVGRPDSRSRINRLDMPMPSAPQALPKAMSKRSTPEPSSLLTATSLPPESSTTTVSGNSPSSRPRRSASSTM